MKEKNTYERKIKMFILRNTPRRNELSRFIVVKCQKSIKNKDFDNRNYHGFYGTNIDTWKKYGHVEIIDGKYHLTDFAVKNWDVSLYHEPIKLKLARLKHERDYYRRRMNELQSSLSQIRHTVRYLAKQLNLIV